MKDPVVVISGLSNTYSGYIATFEEYAFAIYHVLTLNNLFFFFLTVGIKDKDTRQPLLSLGHIHLQHIKRFIPI